MFKVKKKGTEEVFQVLDTYCEQPFHYTYFLVWENNGWRWRPADKFVPPNWKGDENEK